MLQPYQVGGQTPVSASVGKGNHLSAEKLENPGLVHWLAVCFGGFAKISLCEVVLVVKNLPTNAGDIRDVSSVPGLGRSPGRGNGNPLQYSCLQNLMDRGAWWATVHIGSQRVRHD